MDILLATDGSPYALAATDFLSSRLEPGRVRSLRVVAVADGNGEAGGGIPTDGRSPGEADDPEGWVAAAVDILRDGGLDPEGMVVEGDPARILVELAGQGTDLLVAGVKGRGAAPFFELGRVATALKQELPSTLLLVRPAGLGAPTAPGPGPLRVFLPTGDREAEVQGAWRMLQAFRLSRGSVELVALLEGGWGSARERPVGRWAGENRAERRREARHWLERILPELEVDPGPGAVVSASLLEGRPGREIEARIRTSGCDLLILHLDHPAPDGMPNVRGAEDLVWFAPCSVLLLRAPGEGISPGTGEGERFALPQGN